MPHFTKVYFSISSSMTNRLVVVYHQQIVLLCLALFGPYNTRGGRSVDHQAFSFFPELLDGVTCSKMGLELSFRINLQFETHFWCLSDLVPEIQLFGRKQNFLTFRRSEATLAPFVRVPPYENKAFLTNSVIPRQKVVRP